MEKTTFAELMTRWEWKAIRNCPGRFILSRPVCRLRLEDLIGPDARVTRFDVEGARDTVAIAPLADGGMISYERADGTVVHTLNDCDGFLRKLAQLRISLDRK